MTGARIIRAHAPTIPRPLRRRLRRRRGSDDGRALALEADVSARLAMKVLESGLDSALKPTALVMAMFGDDAGLNIYPSVGRVAHLLGVERRTVERNLSRLRRTKILIPISTDEGGRLPTGRGRSVLYGLAVSALPTRPDYQYEAARRVLEPRSRRRGSRKENPDAGVGVHTPETPTPVSSNPDAGVAESRRQCRETPTPASDDLKRSVQNVRENARARAASVLSDGQNERTEPLAQGSKFDRQQAAALFRSVLDSLKDSNPELHARWLKQREARGGGD